MRLIYSILFSTMVLLVLRVEAQDEVFLVSPNLNSTVFDSTVIFKWSDLSLPKPGQVYRLSLAKDSLFTVDNLEFFSGLTNSDTFQLLEEGKYYWKVEIVNASTQNVVKSSTAVYSFKFFDFFKRNDLSHIFLSDSNLIVDSQSRLVSWKNIQDTTQSFTTQSTSESPVFINQVPSLNYRPAISFDGTDDFLDLIGNTSFTDVFCVSNYEGGSVFSSFDGLFTGSNFFLLLGAPGGTQLFGNLPNLTVNHVATKDLAPLDSFKLLNLSGVNINNAVSVFIGRDRASTSRFWNGKVSALLLSDSNLSDSISTHVKEYLCSLYGKSLELGPDFTSTSLCDSSISAPSYFERYLWSNGDTTEGTTISTGSTLTLTVTNKFGCEYQDQIRFKRNINTPQGLSYCAGDSILWNTGLNPSVYSFQWSNGKQDSAIFISSEGDYYVQVTDLNNCSATSDTITFSSDSSVFNTTLGNDTTLCQGARLGLLDNSIVFNSYQWSTGDTTQFSNADTTGSYTLTVSNGNCTKTDTLIVSIAGLAPQPNFDFDRPFANDSVQFTNQTTLPANDSIISTRWDFGDGNQSILTNPKHLFTSAGSYLVTLNVETKLGCENKIEKLVEIVVKPPITRFDLDQERITKVKPRESQTLFSHEVLFHWNRSFLESSRTTYQLDIATDSSFSNILYTNLTSLIRDTVNLNIDGSFFWRVSLIDAQDIIASSDTFKFSIRSILSFNGMNLHFIADSASNQKNSKVDSWYNLVDTSIQAVQLNSTAQPVFIDSISELNNKGVLRFDGNDFFAIDSSANIAEWFCVFNWNGGSTFNNFNGLISTQNSAYVLIASGSGTTSFLNVGSNNILDINEVTTLDASPLIDYKLLNLRSSGNPSFYSDLYIGKDRQISNRNWQGDIAEIMSFSSVLSSEERNVVKEYLCNRYSSEFSLGEDIIMDYGFCDTTLSVQDNFKSYRWSSGDTTNVTSLTPGRSYSLTVTNEFGCEFIDDISIKIPIKNRLQSTFCPNDTSFWEISLPSFNEYDLSWNTSQVDSSIRISSEGDYWFTILDSNFCELVSDTINFQIDSSLIEYNLGKDTSLCRFNLFEAPQPDTIQSFLWSTNDTTPIVSIDTAGLYIIEVDNGLCKAKDSIQINIAGELPQADFSASNFCFGDSVSFFDVSIPPSGDTIIRRSWLFGDGGSDTMINPSYYYSIPNTYNVNLLVQTNKLCIDTISKPITINPKPTAWFGVDESCAKQNASFTDSSQVSSGSINAFYWDFGDQSTFADTSRAQGPAYQYDTLGLYLVTQVVESDQGCKDTIQRFQKVNASPLVDFSFDGFCLNDSTIFTDQTQIASGSITAYKWFFNAGNQNFQETTLKDPTIQFVDTGLTLITLRATSDENCISVHRDSIYMRNNPISNFNLSVYCEDSLFTVSDQTLSQDSIISYLWVLEPGDTSNEVNPTFIKDLAGAYNLKQKVVTTFGCSDSSIKALEVKARPTASFTILNNGSGAPYQLRVSNTSDDATSYEWDLGNGSSSALAEPSIVYPDTGDFEIELTAISQFGCRDSTTKLLTVTPYFLEALLEDIFLRELFDGRLEITARVVNSGNNTINQMRLVATINDEFQFAENTNETIFKGERKAYQFNSTFLQGDNKKVDFVCVKIDQLNQLPYNSADELCEKAFNNELKLELFPNPANKSLNLRYVLPLNGTVEFSVYDQLGRRIMDQEVGNQEEGLYLLQLDVDQLQQGVYFLRFNYNGSFFSETFIIER